MKNRPLVIPEPQAHKELNPSLPGWIPLIQRIVSENLQLVVKERPINCIQNVQKN